MYRKKKGVHLVSISSVDASMASNTSPEVNKAESKKLVQPRLSNFFANAKVHVSSAAPLKCATDENDENIPLPGSSNTDPSECDQFDKILIDALRKFLK